MSHEKAKPGPKKPQTKPLPKGTGTSRSAKARSRREELRVQQEAERARKKRQSIAMAIVCGILAVAIITVVTVVVVQDQRAKREQAAREAKAQITPPNADGTRAIVAGRKAKDATYTLDIYSDYQCPACKQAEDRYGKVWDQLVKDPDVTVRVHTMTFLDRNLHNDSSSRMAIAAACADTVGKYWAYHQATFAHQPAHEGDGYSEELRMKTIPEQAGITGADHTRWKNCVDTNATARFTRTVDDNAAKSGVTSSPTIKINGKNPSVGEGQEQMPWWASLDATPEAWKKGFEKFGKE